MSAPIITGTKIIFGIPECNLPIRCPVAGKRRIMMTKKDVVRLFVNTLHGEREFILCDGGDHWFVDLNLEVKKS